MKSLRIAISAIAILLFLIAIQAKGAFAQGTGQPIHFKLLILGTRYASDVDVLKNNLIKSPLIKNFAPSAISQMNIEFTGSYFGLPDNLLADVRSLASNRFDVESRLEGSGQLVISLRKIQPPPISP